MTSKSDFRADEWKIVASAPIIAAAVISASDDVGEGNDSEDEEIAAFKKALVKLRQKYDSTSLINDAIDDIENQGTKEFDALYAALDATVSHESPLENRIQDVVQAGEIVDRVADKKDAKQYKKFLLDAATAVASASKEGFFVFGSSISKKEAFFLSQLQSALKM